MTDAIPIPWLRRLPIIAIVIVAIIGLVFFPRYLSFEALGRNREWLIGLRDQRYILTAVAFIALYTVIVVLCLPGALIMSLAGGFLFGLFPGILYNVGAATLGAVLLFLAARAGFGRDVAARIVAQGGAIARLQSSLQQNEVWVLLTMRLIPGLPFFLSNIVPAFVGVRFSTFVLTTFVGIIPAGLIYAALGAGLGDIFARGEVPHLNILLRPEFGLPLLGLAALSALPLVVKFVQSKRA